MKPYALTWQPARGALGAALLVAIAVACGWAVSTGRAVQILVLLAILALIALAVLERGAIIGLLVLAAMDGLPFIDTIRPVAKHITGADLASFALIGASVAWTFTAGPSERATRTARTVSWCGVALLAWCTFTLFRTHAGLLPAFQFGADFMSFAALLMVLPRVRLSSHDLRVLLTVLGVGVCLFSVGQILTVEGIASPTWLIHTTATAAELGLTRVYSPMNDLLVAGLAASIAVVVLARARRPRTIAMLLTLLLGTSLVIQLTRARWIALVVSVVLVSLWFALQGERRVAGTLRTRLAIALLAAGTVLTAIILVAPRAIASGAVIQRFLSIFSDIGSTNTATSNVAVREHVANAMLTVLGGRWPIGVGLVPPSAHFFQSLPQGSLRDVDVGVLNAVMTIGVIGAVLIYIPLVIVLFRCMRAAWTRGAVTRPWLNYAGQIWIVATLASSLTLVTLFSKGGVVLSAMIIALLCQPSVTGPDTLPAAELEFRDRRSHGALHEASGSRTATAPASEPQAAWSAAASPRPVFPVRSGRSAPLARRRLLVDRRKGTRALPYGAELGPGASEPALPGSSIRRRLPFEDRSPRAAAALLALTAIVAAGALGFIVAKLNGGGPGPLPLSEHAANGVVQVSLPTGWRQQAVHSPSPLGLTNQIALTPTKPPGAELVIGRSETADPSLLPAALIASLPSVPSPQTVTLGSLKFYRYLNLLPRGQAIPESVYALPTTVGTIIARCVTPPGSLAFTGSCERVLATTRLISGKPVPLGPSAVYAQALNEAIAKLNVVRRLAGSRLRQATTATAQAAAATALALAHTRAASSLGRLDAGPVKAANLRLIGALRETGAAYTALAAAASRNDSAAYKSAQASLARANAALDSAFAQLNQLGYRVG